MLREHGNSPSTTESQWPATRGLDPVVERGLRAYDGLDLRRGGREGEIERGGRVVEEDGGAMAQRERRGERERGHGGVWRKKRMVIWAFWKKKKLTGKI